MIGRHSIVLLRCSATRLQVRHFTPGGRDRKARELPKVLWVVPAITFGLGCWQVQRKAWKENLLAELKAKVLGEAIALPDDLLKNGSSYAEMFEFTPVTVRGKFDHSHEIFLGPRHKQSSLKANSQGGGLVSSGSGTGYQIVTAFQLEDSDQRILVNRGWVPLAKKEAATRPQGQVEHTMEIRGIVRKQEEKPPLSPDVFDRMGTEWHYRDVESFAMILDTLPVCIDADPKGTGAGGPIGGQTPVFLRNEHLQYIVTWYGICLISAIALWKFRRY